MSLPNVGGGYQVGDGNVEGQMRVQGTPGTFTASATITTATLLTGIITADKGSDVATTLTLPTVALLEATLTQAKPDSCFDFSIINVATGSSATVTVAVGTGWTLVGLVTVAYLTSGMFRARKTGATTWSLYRLA